MTGPGSPSRARAIEPNLAAHLIGKRIAGEGRIERLDRARRLAGGQPGIARLDPEIGRARIGGADLAGRLLIIFRRLAPPFERDIGKAHALARIDAAADDPPAAGGLQAGFGRGAHLIDAGAIARARLGVGHRVGRRLEAGNEDQKDGHLADLLHQARDGRGQQRDVALARKAVIAVLDERHLHIV